jgi:hypothetical protein
MLLRKLPTKFLKCVRTSRNADRNNVITTYDRDMICHTKDFRNEKKTMPTAMPLQLPYYNIIDIYG